MALPTTDLMASIAVTRFGLGARPGEIERAKSDPKAFLKSQIRAQGADSPSATLPTSAERFTIFREFQQMERQAPPPPAPQGGPPASPRVALGASPATQPMAMNRRDAVGINEEFQARSTLAINTEAGFRERWTLFWANHFTVSAVKQQSASQAGPFEREAIRPFVFGRFQDLAAAAASHPGMLAYLDQVQSIGPNSPAANRRQQQAGLNENLAREIMELHTVGVDAGYTQADVTELARALTGWSAGRLNEAAGIQGQFIYRQPAHEPGVRQVMGRSYPNTGAQQAYNIILDLANHPASARHIARKLAVHFVSDTPPASLVAKLEKAFTSTRGDLSVVAAALIDADEAWQPAAAKVKTPYEFVISSWRAIGLEPRNPQVVFQAMNQLGQPPFRAPSPKGWPEEAAAWASPDAIIKRLAWTETFAQQQMTRGRMEPAHIAQASLGARLAPRTAAAVLGAESRPEALTLLLMSPEFQRR